MKTILTMLSLAAMLAPACTTQAQRPAGGRPMSPVQSALDTNRDGIISADEIAQSSTVLRKLDKNGDGKLAEDEVRPNFDRANFDRERREGPASNGNEEIVNNLMAFDVNKDGKLAKKEVPERMQGIFARADADHDGFLTRDELTNMAAAQSAASHSERGPGRDEHDEHGARGEGRGRRGGFGGPGGGMLRAMPLLAALDANSDGAISADEINNAPTALKTLDKNGDGQLSEDELRPAFGPGGRGGFSGSPEEMVKRMMEFDKNGDGKLSKDELPDRMQELMERADANHDGFLTQGELKQMAERRGRER